MLNARTLKATAAVAALIFGTAACDEGGLVAPGSNKLRIELTATGADDLRMAEVDLGAVELIDTAGASTRLTDEATDQPIDMLQLAQRVPELITDTGVEGGEYAQLKLYVQSVRVELGSDYTFTTGGATRELSIPAGVDAGIIINLEAADRQDDLVVSGIDLDAALTNFVLVFDTRQSFVLVPDRDAPERITEVVFAPAFRLVQESLAGSVTGTVTTAVAGADVEGLIVAAIPLNPDILEAYQTVTATAVTADDGTYTLPYMVSGDYAIDVTVPAGYTTVPAITEARLGEAENLTGVDFEVVADTGG